MIDKSELIDAPERRSVAASEFEARVSGSILKLEGHASVFDKGYDVAGGISAGGWTEIVTRSAFERTLSEKPDVHLLVNHEGLPLARTKSGTLQLSTDSQGLLVHANLDRRDPDVKSLEIKMERHDLDEMSFAFRVKKQRWSDDETIRSLDEVSLHKGDVSVVNWGANPHTSVSMRSAIELLAKGVIDESELAELRSMSSSEVARAVATLEQAASKKAAFIELRFDDGPNGLVAKLFRSNINGPAGSFVDEGDNALESQDDPAAVTPALAQAVHDLSMRMGAECVNPNAGEKDIGAPDVEYDSAPSAPESRGGIKLADAMRRIGITPASERMTLAEARDALAS